MAGNVPTKAYTVSDLPFWRTGTPDQKRRLAAAFADAHTEAAANYAAVKRHPDVAAELVRGLHMQRIDQWAGYCPPDHTSSGDRNDSVRRDRIVAALSQAYSRDMTGE